MSPLDDLQPQMDWGQNDPVFSDAPSFVDSLPALTPDQQKQEQSDFDKADPFAALDPSATAINPGNVGPVGGGDLNGASYATGSIPFNTIIRIEGGTNRDGSFRTSPKGAWGPAQLMPDTLVQAAKMAGVTPDQARTNAGKYLISL